MRRNAANANRRPLIALATLLTLASAPGCKDEFGKPIKGESVFDFLQITTPTQAAVWAADPYDADKRYRGLLLLSNAHFGGEKVYLEMYRLAASDGDPGVRSVALSALAMHGVADDAPLVARHITDSSEEVRWHACRAMQRMYYPDAVPALLERLRPEKESNVQVRAAAARALGQYQERRVAQGLIASLGERQLTVNENALQSLRILTGEDYGYDDRAWVKWLTASSEPFARAGKYTYPIFERDKDLAELLVPFIPPPPNETQGPVIGAPQTAAAAESPAPARAGESAEPGATKGKGG